MRKLILCGALVMLTALSALGQTNDPVMPTYVAGGLAFNQLAGVNGWVAGIVPVSKQKGVYESTTADIHPATRVDTASGKVVYTASFQLRQGIHKTLYTGQKIQLLVGGDLGVSFASSTSISLATALTGTFVYQLSPHWGVMLPLRALYVPSLGGWNPIAQVGIVWKP